jgi:hypothetical protein
LDLFDAKKAGGVNHMKILALEKEVPGVSDEQFTEESALKYSSRRTPDW